MFYRLLLTFVSTIVVMANKIVLNSLGSNGEYFLTASMNIGSQNQTFTIELDTGSTPLWVPAVGCKLNKKNTCSGILFNYGQSSTFRDNAVNQDFYIQYDDGTSFGGNYVSDTLDLGGIKLPNYIFGLVTNAKYPLDNKDFNIGILGLAPPYEDGSEVASSVLEKIYNSNSANIFSFYLPRHIEDKGIFYIGSTNEIAQDRAVWIDATLTDEAWYLPNMKITGNGQDITGSYATLIDTGSDYLYLPIKDMKKLCTYIGVTYDKKNNRCYSPCDKINNAKNFVLDFGAQKLEVNITDNFYFKDGSDCVLALYGDKPKYGWTLGMAIIRQWYTVWDFGEYKNSKGKVGFILLI